MSGELSQGGQRELERLLALGKALGARPYGRKTRTRLTPPPRTQAAARMLGKGIEWDRDTEALEYRGAYKRTGGEQARPDTSFGIADAADAQVVQDARRVLGLPEVPEWLG